MKLQSLITMLALGAAVSCGDATSPSSPTDLLFAKQRWQASGYHDYRFTLQLQCFCANTNPMRVFVVHDTVLGVIDLHTGESLPATFGVTVDDLFDVVSRAQQRGTPIEATYDATLGFPTTVIDNGPAIANDGGVVYYASDVSKGVFIQTP